MGGHPCKITFDPSGRTVEARSGTPLLEAAALAGFAVNTPCGGAGSCGKCRARLDPAPDPLSVELKTLSLEELEAGWRLLCRHHASGDLRVHLPGSSLFGGDHQIVTEHGVSPDGAPDPVVRQAHVRMTPPSLDEGMPDLSRLDAALRAAGALDAGAPPLAAAPEALNGLTAGLRAADYAGTAVVRESRLLAFCGGADTAPSFGVAVDVGTTTLAAALLDLRDGADRGVAAAMNPQTVWGDDVLSRIARAGRGERERLEMRQAVCAVIAEMIRGLCAEAGALPEQVHALAAAGNTTMESLLCGVDPSPLGCVPFTPAFGDGPRLRARDLGLPAHPDAELRLFPVIGGFVGGDTAAGILAAGLDTLQGVSLLIDIGTNGELVLAHDGALLAASTAAGPAFEGARISCGMRAAHGAVEKVVLGGAPEFSVIGGGPPKGLCGSGLLDLCGQLLAAGLLAPDGRLAGPEALPPDTPEAVAARVARTPEDGPLFVLGGPPERPFGLTQRDVRELQLAAGAIRAGILLLLRQAGLALDDVDRVFIAGGFGQYIRRENALRVGLLPREIPGGRVHYAGNTSLAGAKRVLLSRADDARVDALARAVRHVDLSTDPDFAMEFAMAMYFPG